MDKSIPRSGFLHVADHPDNSAQARRHVAVLKEAGIQTKVIGAKDTKHTKINADLNVADDPATRELLAFVDEALKK